MSDTYLKKKSQTLISKKRVRHLGENSKNSEILVIGAGFAGAATAYFLHQAGLIDCRVLDAAELPGTKSSGLNAAMGRQVIANPEFRALAREGMQFLRNPPPGFSDIPLADGRGSVLMFSSDDSPRATQLAMDSKDDGIATVLWDVQQLRDRFSFLRNVDSAIFTPGDGLIDIHALLYGFLQPLRARDQLDCNAPVEKIVFKNERWFVTTTAGNFSARIVVNAAGAWSDAIATLAGATPAALQIRRRHLFVSRPSPIVNKDWPFIWDLSHQYYFRPESGGVMLSACDETLTSADEAYVEDGAVTTMLLEKLTRHCPMLADIPISKTWAGARTFTADGKPLVRWDERVPQFLWVAGLGGHGATCAAAIGKRAAALIANSE